MPGERFRGWRQRPAKKLTPRQCADSRGFARAQPRDQLRLLQIARHQGIDQKIRIEMNHYALVEILPASVR